MLSTQLALGACSSRPPAPVVARHQPPSIKINTHVVAKGETLYSIAWAYGLDYRALARANGIDKSYTIHSGQVLRLSESSQPATGKKPVSAHVVADRPPVSPPKPTTPTVLTKSKSPPVVVGDVAWQWPATGNVIQGFSNSGNVNKGIDIAGNLGEPVRASASGRVVYAGSGLLGYGLLVILKHNDQFLSAYAHNRVLWVKEGDSVKVGDKIAEIGASGAEKVKLHFEIRRDGKPVDPEEYLPRRR